MTLPNNHANISAFFDKVLILLKNHQWIYNFPNTDILVQDVFEEVPKEWRSYLEKLNFSDLKALALCRTKDECPQSLQIFLEEIKNLSIPEILIEQEHNDFNLGNNCGLSIKKKHEIVSLVPVIADMCKKTGTSAVTDIGAGLGYLSYLLADNHNFSVLAVEGCPEKMKLALENQSKYHESSKDMVKFHHHFITKDSLHEMEDAITKQFNNKQSICICGLHACADLSITILELFLNIKQAKSLVIMPCCYHRLNLEKTIADEEYFSSFPVSSMLKSKFLKYNAFKFVRRPFLRLACQQTMISFLNMTDEEHVNHATQLLRRAVLQKAVNEVGCSVIRLRRKTGNKINESNSFASYLEDLSKNYKLVSKNPSEKALKIEDLEFKRKIMELWENHKEKLLLVEVLTAFQALIQSLCEHILLRDRVEFLRENSVNCFIKKVTDDNISPRCYALVAIKNMNGGDC